MFKVVPISDEPKTQDMMVGPLPGAGRLEERLESPLWSGDAGSTSTSSSLAGGGGGEMRRMGRPGLSPVSKSEEGGGRREVVVIVMLVE